MKATQQLIMKQGTMALYQALREAFFEKLLDKSLDNGFVKTTKRKMYKYYEMLKKSSLFPLEEEFWDVFLTLEEQGYIECRHGKSGHVAFRTLLN